jgi:hypothetical protein
MPTSLLCRPTPGNRPGGGDRCHGAGIITTTEERRSLSSPAN